MGAGRGPWEAGRGLREGRELAEVRKNAGTK